MLAVVDRLCAEPGAHTVDRLGRNALHYAAIHGQSKIIDYLVAHGFAVDEPETPTLPNKINRCRKRTALHLAAWRGQTEVAIKLMALGADPDKEDATGNTMVEYGVMSKSVEMLQLIQQLPAYHDKSHDTRLLHTAAASNHVEVLSELILDDVNLNAVDKSGSTALHVAAINNAGDVASLLVAGDDVAPDIANHAGDTALHVAARQGHVRLIETLIGARADIDKKNQAKLTPLYIACEQGHLGAVSSLLKYRADLTIGNSQGLSPQQIAENNDHTEIVKILKH